MKQENHPQGLAANKAVINFTEEILILKITQQKCLHEHSILIYPFIILSKLMGNCFCLIIKLIPCTYSAHPNTSMCNGSLLINTSLQISCSPFLWNSSPPQMWKQQACFIDSTCQNILFFSLYQQTTETSSLCSTSTYDKFPC